MADGPTMGWQSHAAGRANLVGSPIQLVQLVTEATGISTVQQHPPLRPLRPLQCSAVQPTALHSKGERQVMAAWNN